MDENKLKKLKEQKYKIHKSCGLCVHFYGNPYNDWGTCSINTYEHLKHTESTRLMSVYKFGGCEKWEASNFVTGELEEFYQFL